MLSLFSLRCNKQLPARRLNFSALASPHRNHHIHIQKRLNERVDSIFGWRTKLTFNSVIRNEVYFAAQITYQLFQ